MGVLQISSTVIYQPAPNIHRRFGDTPRQKNDTFQAQQRVDMTVVTDHSMDDAVSSVETAVNGSLLPGVYMPGDAAVQPCTRAKQEKQHKAGLTLNLRKLACLAAPERSIAQPAQVAAALDAGCTEPTCQSAGGFPSANCHTVEQSAAPSYAPLSASSVTNNAGRLHNRRASVLSIELKPIPETRSHRSELSEEEWYDIDCVFSSDICAKQQQQQQPAPLPGNWIPDTPLLFAEPGLHFVPVPKVTGFAGYWEVDESRTTPHPQPIDIMIGANLLVRRVHKAIAAMEITETDGQLMIAGQPTFIPPGFPSICCEVYDKTNSTISSWTPRRDLKLGSCSGKIYMTDTNMLVLRVESRTAFTHKVEYIVEDYITLEEGGQVILDHMCCYEVATGRRETQVQVARLRHDKA